MDSVLFYFFGMPVYVYGFLISLGLLFGTTSALSAGRRRGISWYNMFDFILGTAIVFFLAGRLSVLIQESGAIALIRPWRIFTDLSAGLDMWVGLVFGIIYALISALRNRIFGLDFLDAITPGIILVALFASLGSNVFGKVTELPWAIQLGDFSLHPVPLYAALGYHLIRFVLKNIEKHQRFSGQILISAATLIVWLKWLLLFVSEDASRIYFWIYPIVGLLLAALWSFGHINSPAKEYSKGLIYWLVQIVKFIIIAMAICFFFYLRF